ncbi:general transcription factor 3C polypeptide 5 [Ochlerotatus camptorhynchus]|uniref:general transcription factor 3C polypeptide 5 n=1 Tax=Ochlerotatus camptorhynchus TaxID=644619 RepID=UPI0031CF59D8
MSRFKMECDPMNSHRHKLGKELVCIEYPGVVRNPDRMMASLGGAAELSMAICSEKRRLEVRFRPESMYSKPAFGDRNNTTGLVLKVKTRRKRSQPNEVEIRSLEIGGRVSMVFKFETMCDFQLLPAFRNQTTGVVDCLYDKMVPKGLTTLNPTEGGGDVPYFLPPIMFSRFDTAQLSIFKTKDVLTDLLATGESERARRTKHGIYQSFNLIEPFPTDPNPLAIESLKMRNIRQEVIDSVTKKFEERPIWTKSALKGNLSEDDVRYLLPTFGFYFVNGPWRGTWVRFGYDPRKLFESRYYQLLDFRVRAIGAMHDKVKVKRSQNPVRPCMRSNPVTSNRDASKSNVSRTAPKQRDYAFTMDTLPQMRIIFYQYCDVHVPRIQQMLEKIPTPKTGVVCNEKTGWLPPRFDEQCRDILTEIVLKNFKDKKDDDPSASELETGDETEVTYDEEEDDSEDELRDTKFIGETKQS